MSGEPDHTRSSAYVLALDVGTSTIRAHVYDNKAVIRGTKSCKVMAFALLAFNKFYVFFLLLVYFIYLVN